MKRTILLIGVAVFLFALPANGALITIGIEAVVDGVHDPDNYLEGLVNIGDLITGTYTYDTDTADSSPLANVGRYEHYAYPCGISLSVGGLDFGTDPAVPYVLVEVGNDIYVDDYLMRSHNNLPLSNGTSVNNISWSLQDTSATAITNIELPRTAPVLSDWQVNYLNIEGPGRRDNILFQGHVTSAVVIPEPATILLLGFGAIALIRKVRK